MSQCSVLFLPAAHQRPMMGKLGIVAGAQLKHFLISTFSPLPAVYSLATHFSCAFCICSFLDVDHIFLLMLVIFVKDVSEVEPYFELFRNGQNENLPSIHKK